MKTEVKLITFTKDPIETMYILWEASRDDNFTDDVETVKWKMASDEDYKKNVRSLFSKILKNHIPIAENISFVFMLDNVSVALREQMVRHRVGNKIGERIGFDYIPDLHDSSWWSQTMRVLPMDKFVDNDHFHTPEKIKSNETANMIYKKTMNEIQKGYHDLCEAGIPMEEARMLIPIAAEHRISWSINLATLAHIISKRSCWIAQLGLWEDVILGMIREISSIDPIFQNLATPPCISDNKFSECFYALDSKKRLDNEDPLPVCPLYLNHCGCDDDLKQRHESKNDYITQCAKFDKFWNIDINTGKCKEK